MIRRILSRLRTLFTQQRHWVRRGIATEEDLRASGHGERQAAPVLSDIRPDHIARYEFAARYLSTGAQVLDVACGVGYGTYLLATTTQCARVLGLDISPDAIAYARAHYANQKIQYSECNGICMNLSPRAFDAAVSLETIEHIKDDQSFLHQLHNAIRPGGQLIISSPNETALPYNPVDFDFHVRHYTPDELTETLQKQRFRVDERFSQPSAQEYTPVSSTEGHYLIYVCTRL